MKRVFSVALILAMLLAMCIASVEAQEEWVGVETFTR